MPQAEVVSCGKLARQKTACVCNKMERSRVFDEVSARSIGCGGPEYPSGYRGETIGSRPEAVVYLPKPTQPRSNRLSARPASNSTSVVSMLR